MKKVKAGYEIIKESDVRKRIERGARLCYKSEDFIKEGSDVKIITALGKKQHTAMFEHGNLALDVPLSVYSCLQEAIANLNDVVVEGIPLAYSVVKRWNYLRFTGTYTLEDSDCTNGKYIISGNMRAWIESITNLVIFGQDESMWVLPTLANIVINIMGTSDILSNFDAAWTERANDSINAAIKSLYDDLKAVKVMSEDDIKGLGLEERLIHDTLSVIFTVDRGITHELVRMRRASFAQESTRYCNYSGDKYGNEITVIEPVWYEATWSEATKNQWERAMIFAEEEYLNMMQDPNVKAQQARAVLPNSTKSDIMVTAPLDEWRHIFALRACDATGPAHPQMKEVMVPLLKEVKTLIPEVFDDLQPAEIL